MKKYITLLLTICLAFSLLIGCGNKKKDGDLTVYYLSIEGTELVKSYFTPTDDKPLLDQCMDALCSQPDDSDMMMTIPDSISILNYQCINSMLMINFSDSYKNLDQVTEVLMRAAIVRTVTQLDSIDYVSFNVAGEPLKDAKGIVVGTMTSGSFVDSADASISTTVEAKITLSFSSADGDYLVQEVRNVRYNSNDSIEKLIVKSLLDGPNTSGLRQTIPSSTNIINVSVSDGVCYVNLDANFLNQNQEIAEGCVLYSIVNSLTELQEVEKVQLSINGDTTGKVRYIYDLSNIYERNEKFYTKPEEMSTQEENE